MAAPVPQGHIYTDILVSSGQKSVDIDLEFCLTEVKNYEDLYGKKIFSTESESKSSFPIGEKCFAVFIM